MIDTHCHLDDARYGEDIEAVIERALSLGVRRFLIPGAGAEDLPRAMELSERFEGVYFAAGIHPYHIHEYDEATLRAALTHPRCIAVGECGLDYYRLEGDEVARLEEKRAQKEVFIAQMELAKEYQKPLIVHIREASGDSLELLKQHGAGLEGVLHCYNADAILLELASRGFYYGIGGVLTFQNARRLVEILPQIPLDRLLLETDAPYLTPHPHRGSRNEPSYIPLIAQKMATILNREVEEIARLTDQNATRLFRELAS